MSITPGPWTAQHSLSGEVDIDAADDSLICQIPVCEVAAKERMANARAIAALPELLAACEGLMREMDSEVDRNGTVFPIRIVCYYKHLALAVKKARGS